MQMMTSFDEAVKLYLEKGKSFLLKATIKHGQSGHVAKQLFEAIENEGLLQLEKPEEKPEPKQKTTPAPPHNSSLEDILLALKKALVPHYDKAKMLHSERCFIVEQNLILIKRGEQLPDTTQLAIAARTREIHEIFDDHIQPTWAKIDAISTTGRLPEEKPKVELTDDPVELIKRRNALRSYISRCKTGKMNPDSLPIWEQELAEIEIKLLQRNG